MKQPLITLLLATLAATTASASPPVNAAEPQPPAHWQPTWISSPQRPWGADWVLPLGMPASLRDVTLRQAVHTSLGGDRLRLVVSNEYSASPLKVGGLTIRSPRGGAAAALRFHGRDGVTVAPGARVVSDPLKWPTAAGDSLEVDLYLPGRTALAGFHWNPREQTLLLRGRAPAGGDAVVAEKTTGRAFVTELLVEAARPPAVVVAFGDSLTDGNGPGVGAGQRWPDLLARRLAPHGVAVLNAGIGGNRLLTTAWGDSGLARFERDALRHAGVRAVIILLGTNDIGFPGGSFAPKEAPATLQSLTAALRRLAGQARARGVRVVGATLPPFERALEGTPLEGHHRAEKEVLRQSLNQWIRGSGAFDAVVDFDAALRDPGHPSRFHPPLDSGDHLHPGEAGYRRMAEAIDLNVLSAQAPVKGAR